MSSARGRRGSATDADAGAQDDRNLLVLPIASVALALKPRVVVVENVPAFLTKRVRHPVTRAPISAARLLISLLGKEYFVFPFLADLSEFGVPQTRKRSFLTFVRFDEPCLIELLSEGLVPYPPATHGWSSARPVVTLRKALRALALPKLDAKTLHASRDPERSLHCVPVWSPKRYAMVSSIPRHTGLSAWQTTQCNACGDVTTRKNAVHCSECHTPLPKPIMRANGRDRLIRGFHNSTYRRMRSDAPARTITTASGRIGGNHTIHPFENRVLSPLECAHLQTFPEGFLWGNTIREHGMTSVRAMIGEAVPPLFTKLHGTVLAAFLRGRTALSSRVGTKSLTAERLLDLDAEPTE
jgi:DNA (cytosine-5)-methyltransferase 1